MDAGCILAHGVYVSHPRETLRSAGKGIVIANLGSVVNPAIISMARRKAREEAEGSAKYLRGVPVG